MEQILITPDKNYKDLYDWVRHTDAKKILVVSGNSIKYQKKLIERLKEIEKSGTEIINFNDFRPNPQYEDVQKGVRIFRSKHCDAVIAAGGGSAIDVAKCIKLYSSLPGNGENGKWLTAECCEERKVPFLAIPTTAGTGSEATRYAVIYYDGKKQSVTSGNILPEAVLLDPDTLISLPAYQKKTTMCDALCHAIESYWSIHSNDKSKEYSRIAIKSIVSNMEKYINNTASGRKEMLIAANTAGKAIDITQTTAGHAMCYGITSLFGCAHGHAAMLCDRVLFPWMIKNTDKCIDPRGADYLKKVLDEIGIAMGCKDAKGGADKLNRIFNSLELSVPEASEEQCRELAASVNPVRLKNHPASMDTETIYMLYHMILNGDVQ